jgi:hypothetical protein
MLALGVSTVSANGQKLRLPLAILGIEELIRGLDRLNAMA